jgi:hypothetical protein
MRGAGRSAVALLALCAVLVGAPAARAAINVEVSGGALRITDDPGGTGANLVVQYKPGRGIYDFFNRGSGEIRPGAGCNAMTGTPECSAAGVGSIVTNFGDGSDNLNFGVDVISPERAPVPVPLTVIGAPGDFGVDAYGMANQPITFEGGPGNDGMSAPEGTTQVRFDGGEGNDSLGTSGSSGPILFEGGPGNDRAGMMNVAGPVELRAGEGNDHLATEDGSSPVTMDGGEGDDEFEPSGGVTAAYGGPGDDRFLNIQPDDEQDIVDCGPGIDEIRSGLERQGPAREDDYSVDCPPVDARYARTGKIVVNGSTGSAVIKLESRIAQSVDAKLLLPGRKSRTLSRVTGSPTTTRFRLGQRATGLLPGNRRRVKLDLRGTAHSSDGERFRFGSAARTFTSRR